MTDPQQPAPGEPCDADRELWWYDPRRDAATGLADVLRTPLAGTQGAAATEDTACGLTDRERYTKGAVWVGEIALHQDRLCPALAVSCRQTRAPT